MLVTPDADSESEPAFDPSLTVAEPPQSEFPGTNIGDETLVSTKILPPAENDEAANKSQPRPKSSSLPPPPVAPPKSGSSAPKPSASKASDKPTLPKLTPATKTNIDVSLSSPTNSDKPSIKAPLPSPVVKAPLPSPVVKTPEKSTVSSTPGPVTVAPDKAFDSGDDSDADETTEIGSDPKVSAEDAEESIEELDGLEVLDDSSDIPVLEDDEAEIDELDLDELETNEPEMDELATAILEPPSKEVLAAASIPSLAAASPFEADLLSENTDNSSPFDENLDESLDVDEEVLTKTVADVSVDIALSVNKVKRESESTPDVFTRTVADAMPVASPTPPPEKVSQNLSPVSLSADVSGSPSSVLPSVLTPPPPSIGQSPSQVLPHPPAAQPPTMNSDASAPLPTPPPSETAPAAFVAPKSWNAEPSQSSPDTMAEIPASYALPGVAPAPVASTLPAAHSSTAIPSVAIPTPHSGIPTGAIPTPLSGAIPVAHPGASGVIPQMTPAPPHTIGPPPEISPTASYPGNALAALGDEGIPNPTNPNQVWKQAHPSAQKWAQKRQQGAPRTPRLSMIAVGLLLSGLGIYLLSIFLPSKVPLSAAEKLALASQAGVDENAWRFTEQLVLAAKLNAGLFVFLGVVVVLRGALFRLSPTAAGRKKSGKTSILLIFCFVLLALSFGALLFTGSTA